MSKAASCHTPTTTKPSIEATRTIETTTTRDITSLALTCGHGQFSNGLDSSSGTKPSASARRATACTEAVTAAPTRASALEPPTSVAMASRSRPVPRVRPQGPDRQGVAERHVQVLGLRAGHLAVELGVAEQRGGWSGPPHRRRPPPRGVAAPGPQVRRGGETVGLPALTIRSSPRVLSSGHLAARCGSSCMTCSKNAATSS
jgi:hypothetical protein